VANILRFVILGEDKGGPAFAQFTRQVELANKAVDRNNAALKQQGSAASAARNGISGLAGEVTGVGAAFSAASSGGEQVQARAGRAEPRLRGPRARHGRGGRRRRRPPAGLAAAGAGLGAFGLVAKANFTAASTAATAASTAQTAHATAVAKVTGQYQYAMSVAKTRAQRQAAYAAEQKGFNTAELAQTAALSKAYAGLSPAQAGMAKQLASMKTQWQSFTATFAPMLNQMLTKVTPVFGIILKDIGKLATAGGTAIQALLPSVGAAIGSSGFQKFITMLATSAAPAIVRIGVAVGNVVVGIGGILKAFMPTSQQMLTGIDKITAKFREWGTTLSGHTGFQSLMQTFRTETPQAMAILTNLGTVITNVGKAMFGLSTFSNSRLLLSALLPLSGVMASLSKNTDLVRVAMYALLAVKIGQQFSWVTDAWKGIVKFAAAAEGATVAETIAAAATRAWGLAMAALPWVALAAAVVAVAVLIIKYHTQIWHFMIQVWNDILGAISRVWGWIQKNWPLLVGIMTGPVGLAVVWIIKHWTTMTTGIAALFDIAKNKIGIAWDQIELAALRGVKFILDTMGKLPFGMGQPFRDAAKSIGNTMGGIQRDVKNRMAQVQADVDKLHGKNITVKVFASGGGGMTFTQKVAASISSGGFSLHSLAAGGRLPGYGGGDRHPALLESGETVVSKEHSRALASVFRAVGVPGYASGGIAGMTPWVANAETGFAQAAESSFLRAELAQLKKAVAAAAAAFTAIPGRNVGSGVMRWAPLVLQALKMEGLGSYLASQVLYQMQTESGGNPNIFNTTDINAQHGTPSGGLMQVIGPTFRAYHWPGTSFNLLDPLANIAAAINYARHRYGPTLMSGGMGIGSGHGYAYGTSSAAPGWAWVGERGPELMRFRGGEQVTPAGAAGGGNTYNITVNVPPGTNKADAGRAFVECIRQYEKGSGTGWRR